MQSGHGKVSTASTHGGRSAEKLMAHTRQCEESVYPDCACTCGGEHHGISSGTAAIEALATTTRPVDEPQVSPTMVRQSRRHLRKRARALGKPVRGSTFSHLVENPDIFCDIATAAIAAGKDAATELRAGGDDRLRLPSEKHLICDLLAQAALALDEAIAAGKQATAALARGIVPDGWRGHGPLVIKALRITVDKLVAKTVDFAFEASGLGAALNMARIGAVAFCPRIGKHQAVRECAAPLVEEQMADGLAASLRDLAPSVNS